MTLRLVDGQRVVWTPLPGSQRLVASCPASVILYDGTRGPGKTDSQLMRFRRRVGLGYGRFWRGVIFDREYKNLDDLVSKSQRWFPEFGDGAKFLQAKSDYKWVWPTGEELYFRSIKKLADYWNYHGQEFPFIGWNELTKYPTSELYDLMMSCNRSSFRPEDYPIETDEGVILLPEIPLEVFATTNPFGAGHSWVKERFIDVAPLGKIVKRVVNVFNPRTQQRENVVKTQVRIFGSYRENIYLSPEYIAELESITDENKRKAWLFGSWEVTSGGMFDGEWDAAVHKVAPFPIPHSWKITRSFDYGSSAPFSVGFWAISDGSDVQMADGTWRSTVRGDVFRIGEWYGTTGKANEGLRLLANEIAAGIVRREMALGIYGRVFPGPADNSIFDLIDGRSIAERMEAKVEIGGKMYPGIFWERSNKSPGSRIAGWDLVRSYLKNAKPKTVKRADGQIITVPRNEPGMFVFDTCKSFIKLFPILPRDEANPDDVDTDSEDHIGDEVRYLILDVAGMGSGNRTKGMG